MALIGPFQGGLGTPALAEAFPTEPSRFAGMRWELDVGTS